MQNLCHWIFDLDGTLTIAQHDFDAIRRELGVPEGTLILEYIAQCPADRARALERQLHEIEHDLAEQSLAAEGAVELVEMLLEADADLGILTRNTRQNAMTSLASVARSLLCTREHRGARRIAAQARARRNSFPARALAGVARALSDGRRLSFRPGSRPRRRGVDHPCLSPRC